MSNNQPYTTPTAAISAMLSAQDFDALVIDKGRVRLTIEGDFQQEGCVIFGMTLVGVRPTEPKRASAVEVLRALADATGAPGPRYVVAANAAQMRTLDEYCHSMDGDPADAIKHVVEFAIRANRTGKPLEHCGLFILPHAAPAVRVLIDLLEAP